MSARAVVVDTREQTPWSDLWPEGQVATVRRKLDAGDYSIAGHEEPGPFGIAIERKSMADLVGSLTRDRRRFDRCLARLRAYRWHAIVVEGDWQAITSGRYRSTVPPSCIIGSVAAIVADGTPVLFAGNASDAATLGLRLLTKFQSRARAARSHNPSPEAA